MVGERGNGEVFTRAEGDRWYIAPNNVAGARIEVCDVGDHILFRCGDHPHGVARPRENVAQAFVRHRGDIGQTLLVEHSRPHFTRATHRLSEPEPALFIYHAAFHVIRLSMERQTGARKIHGLAVTKRKPSAYEPQQYRAA